MAVSRYIPSQLDDIENIEEYRPGGYHPISIRSIFANGRYTIIHKLGFGSSSTVWLARDHQTEPGKLVTMKALRADVSSNHYIPELVIPQLLHSLHISNAEYQTIIDHFTITGPNGTHRFLVSPFAGPNILAMRDCPGRVSGSRRLRSDLARKVAKQVVTAIHGMHGAGLVHGDITSMNVLFRISDHVLAWSNEQVYSVLGYPVTEPVRTRAGGSLDEHAPAELVESLRLTDMASLLQESVVLQDFGQSYALTSPPPDYQPGTLINYLPPETRFEGRAGMPMDIWTCGCAIFEIRAGFPLFEPFLASDSDILRQTVETLGKLPDPWWASFPERDQWFREGGESRSLEDQTLTGILVPAEKSSIRDKLRSIGKDDDPPSVDEGPMIEKSGMVLPQNEVELLGDLLEKMLKYWPEDRLTIQEVIRHPWFAM